MKIFEGVVASKLDSIFQRFVLFDSFSIIFLIVRVDFWMDYASFVVDSLRRYKKEVWT